MNNETEDSNKKLGYNEFFESNRGKLGLGGFPVARVTAEHRGAYKVKNAEGEYLARITGKQMFKALAREDYPAVGDWVAIEYADKEQAVIHGILPRKTLIKRKYIGKNETQVIAANIDVAFAVEAVGRDYNLNRFERYFAIASEGGIKPAIILNKIDLAADGELDSMLEQIKARFGGIDIFPTSVSGGSGLDKLKAFIEEGKTYCFLGSSGVGKSSLINELIGKNVVKTGGIGERTRRGKHVTTARVMYFLENGGIVIDNPGMREVGMAEAAAGIDDLFDEITALAHKCKYADCTHVHEPGCEVLAAVKAGKLDEGKYSNYVKLKEETEFYELTKAEKREKDRQFGKFIKGAKKDLRKYGHKAN